MKVDQGEFSGRLSDSGDRKTLGAKVIGVLVLVVVLIPALGCSNYMSRQDPLWIQPSVHPMGTTSLAFDPDGRRLASGGFTGEIIIWSVPSGKRLMLLKPQEDSRLHLAGLNIVKGTAWLKNNRLVSASSDGSLQVWDISTGSQAASVKTPSSITSMTCLPHSGFVITGHRDGRVRAYRLPGLTFAGEYEMGSAVLSIAGDRAEQRVAVSAGGGEVCLLSGNLHPVKKLEHSPKDALEIRFSPDGRQLAAGGWYKIMFWDLESGHVRQIDTEHWGAIISIDYSPDGKYLVSLGRITDANIRLRNIETGAVERRLLAHKLCGRVIRFSPDGRYIASGSDDESVRLYDLNEPYSSGG